MLTELLTWWLQHMSSLLPVGLRRWRGRARNTAVVEWAGIADGGTDAAVRLFRGRRGREQPPGHFVLDASGTAAFRAAVRASGLSRIVLRVPPTDLLEQTVVLPLAAERGVGQVLAYDMDRLTPFRASAVFWNWAIERRDRAQGKLHVRLSLVPRIALEPLVSRLGGAGILPTTIEVQTRDGGSRSLAVTQETPQDVRRGRRATQAAAAGCAVLGTVVVVLPFALQSLAIRHVEQRIAAVQPKVTEAEALRRRIAGQATGVNALGEQRARAGDAVAALAAVTGILPDGTYLSEFSLAQRQIAISGRSTQAARLIPALSIDPSIRNPSFAAPVTRTGSNGADLFSIRAELAP